MLVARDNKVFTEGGQYLKTIHCPKKISAAAASVFGPNAVAVLPVSDTNRMPRSTATTFERCFAFKHYRAYVFVKRTCCSQLVLDLLPEGSL